MNIMIPWRRSTPLGRGVFLAAAIVATLYGGAKPTNQTNRAPRRLAPSAMRMTPSAMRMAQAPQPESTGIPPISVSPWPYESFVKPSTAESFSPWHLHGAIEAWTCVTFGNVCYSAFANGKLRSTPRDAASELGIDLGRISAVPNVSELWWKTEPNGTRTVTWQDFKRDGSDELISIMLRIGETGYAVRTNGVVVASAPEEDATLREPPLLQLYAPEAVYSHGYRGALSASLLADRPTTGTLTLTVSGGEHISLWTAYSGGSEVSLPKTFDAETFGGVTYYVQYESTSTSVGDISFSLNFQSDDNSTSESTITETMTAAEVVELSVSSTPAGEGSLDIPGGTSNIYGPTEISASTPHLMIPFSAVSANGVTIDDFTISASLEILPAGLEESAYWSLSDTTPLNTVLMSHENNLAEIVNPKVGGIYGISAEIGGVTTSATIILPLAGAEISADIEGLFAYADDFVSSVSNSYAFISSETSLEGLLHEVFIGFYWFGSAWNGYFTGRPDAFSPRQQTVRWYNQVNDDNGRGAIATLYGCPIYLEKMSNLFAAYACEKLGVDAWKQEMSQSYGTPNDYAAIASWQTGVSLAHLGTGQIETKLRALALGSWRNTEANEPKLRNLWPNPANAVNFCGKNENDNFDTEYYAPGFLYLGGNDHE